MPGVQCPTQLKLHLCQHSFHLIKQHVCKDFTVYKSSASLLDGGPPGTKISRVLQRQQQNYLLAQHNLGLKLAYQGPSSPKSATRLCHGLHAGRAGGSMFHHDKHLYLLTVLQPGPRSNISGDCLIYLYGGHGQDRQPVPEVHVHPALP